MKKYLMFLFAVCFAAVSLVAQTTAPDVSERMRPGPERSATFTVTVVGVPPFTYQWFKNGVAIPNANAAVYRIAPVVLSDGAVYTVTIGTGDGPINSPKATLIVTNPPVVTGMTIEKDKPAVPAPVAAAAVAK